MTVLRNSSFWQRHLPSVTRFFQYDQWNEQGVQQTSTTEDPFMLITDDSICPKTKSSSQALEPPDEGFPSFSFQNNGQ
ncbi:hypothetical protein [Salibacterium sp. K-3]